MRYVLVRDGTPLPEQYTLAYDAPGPLAVYENPDPLPRAWLVSAAQILPNEEAVLTALQQPSFEPLHTVVLMQNDAHPPTSAESSPSSMGAPVSILFYSENQIVLATSAERPGYLVLSEVWYPGWRATVNSEAAPVLRANYTLRALPVPAGELTIRLWYAPASWRRGLALFGVGILLLAGLFLWRVVALKERNVQRVIKQWVKREREEELLRVVPHLSLLAVLTSCLRQHRFRHLADHRVGRIIDVAKIVFHRLTHQNVRSYRINPQILLQPADHLCRGMLRGLI